MCLLLFSLIIIYFKILLQYHNQNIDNDTAKMQDNFITKRIPLAAIQPQLLPSEHPFHPTFFLIVCGLHDSNSHGKLHSILRQGRSTHTNPASRHSHAFAHPRTPHNCILQSWLMLMHPGWKWQEIVEGQSLNEPLWDRSWLLTIPLQLIRQGNSRPRCFTHRVPPTAAIFLFWTNQLQQRI